MDVQFIHNQEMIIEFTGRLDTNSSTELSKKLQEEKINENLVIFDMKKTEYISSAGLRLLLSLKKDLEKEGKKLEIHNPNNVCLEVFKVTGFVNILDVK